MTRSFYIGDRQNYRSRNGATGAMGYNMYEKKALALHVLQSRIWHANC